MSDYKPGDRVRVTFEATYEAETDNTYQLVDADEDFVELPKAGLTIEKLTPDYEQQVRDLQPGTAFELSLAGIRSTYLRVNDGDVVTPFGTKHTVAKLFELLGRADDVRVLS